MYVCMYVCMNIYIYIVSLCTRFLSLQLYTVMRTWGKGGKLRMGPGPRDQGEGRLAMAGWCHVRLRAVWRHFFCRINDSGSHSTLDMYKEVSGGMPAHVVSLDQAQGFYARACLDAPTQFTYALRTDKETLFCSVVTEEDQDRW